MKFTADRPFADRDVAARRLVEIANGVEPVQDGPHRHRAADATSR